MVSMVTDSPHPLLSFSHFPLLQRQQSCITLDYQPGFLAYYLGVL